MRSFFLFFYSSKRKIVLTCVCIYASVYQCTVMVYIYIYIYIIRVYDPSLSRPFLFFFFSPLFVLTRNNKFVTTRDRGQTDEFRGRFRLLRVVLQPCHLCVQIRDNTRVVTSIRLHGTLYSDTQKSSGSGSFEAAA